MSSDTSETDNDLIRRFVRENDSAAFEAIVERYTALLTALTGRFLRSDEDAEEIVQDTFMRAHKKLAEFRGDCSLKTWLTTVAWLAGARQHWAQWFVTWCALSAVAIVINQRFTKGDI